jgi:hypothetical protein
MSLLLGAGLSSTKNMDSGRLVRLFMSFVTSVNVDIIVTSTIKHVFSLENKRQDQQNNLFSLSHPYNHGISLYKLVLK